MMIKIGSDPPIFLTLLDTNNDNVATKTYVDRAIKMYGTMKSAPPIEAASNPPKIVPRATERPT